MVVTVASILYLVVRGIDQDSNKEKGLVLDMCYKRVGRTYEKSMKSF